MEDQRFDRFTEALATTGSRRQALRGLLGGGLAVGGLVLLEDDAAARTYTREEIVAIIREAARMYRISAREMLRVARCESNLNPRAYNPSGPWYGLFQFHPNTWELTPYERYSWYNPKANARAAGWLWSTDGPHHWACY